MPISSSSSRRITWFIHAGFFIGMIAYIFSFKYLPFQDFPQWVYHGHVFNQIIFHHNDFGGYFSFFHYVPPNAVATVGIGLLELAFPPLVAGKLFFLSSVGLIYLGSVRVLQVMTGSDHPLFAAVSVVGALNLFVYMGYMNYVFGLGVALVAIGFLLTHKSKVNPWTLSIFFLLCYCSHFVSFLLLGVAVLAVLISERDWLFFRKALLAMVPSIALGLHYYFSKQILTFSSSGIIRDSYLVSLQTWITHWPAGVVPFHRIKHVYEPGILANIVNYASTLFMMAGTAIFVIHTILKRDRRMVAVLAAILIPLVLISPQYFGGLFNIGERFLYLLWLVLLAYYFEWFSLPNMRNVAAIAAMAISISAFFIFWTQTANFNAMNIEANTEKLGVWDQHGGSNPFSNFYYYRAIEQNDTVPIFHHALLNNRGAQSSKPFDE
jgi:hypothetical protein